MAKILIVEDEAIVACDLKATLESMGYTVTGIASSGQKALDLADKDKPDLVLMDIVIQGDMDGIETAAQFRQGEIPVVYLTAYQDGATLRRAKITGPFGYITKPFGECELKREIELALYNAKMVEALKSSKEWFRGVVESDIDGVMLVDEKGVILYMNPAVKTLFGRKNLDLLGQSFGEASERNVRTEVDIVRGDGTLGVAEMRAVAVRWEGSAATRFTFRDITDRKAVEQERADRLREVTELSKELKTANERLRQLSQMKSGFVRTVSHELRTPLAGILGAVENVLGGLHGEITEDQRLTMEIIERCGSRLSRIIVNLLDLSQIEEGRLKSALIFLDLRAPVKIAATEAQDILEKNGRELAMILPDRECLVYGDHDGLVRIATNLLGNAMRFAQKKITLRIEADESMTRLVVEDDGPGIPNEQFDELFKAFSNIQEHRGKSQTGLGLNICVGLAKVHGGGIRAENRSEKEGGGARFTFEIPTGHKDQPPNRRGTDRRVSAKQS